MAEITTCAVLARIWDSEGGDAIEGAGITAELKGYDVDNGFVTPHRVRVLTDVNGEATLDLWPNALGSRGTYYEITVDTCVSKAYRFNAVVPNTPTALLHEISALAPYPGKPDGVAQVAIVLAAQAVVLAARDVTVAAAAAADADAQQTAADRVQTGADRSAAGVARVGAEAAQASAELSFAGSVAGAQTYTTTAQGLAKTTSGQMFLLRTSNLLVFDVYLNNAGAANLLGQMNIASGAVVAQLQSAIQFFAIPGFAVSFIGGDVMSVGIADDGTLMAASADITSLIVQNLIASAYSVGDGRVASAVYPGFAAILASDKDQVASVGVRDDGTLEAVALNVQYINGQPVGSSVERSGGIYPYQLNFHNNSGESLAEGSTGTALTTTAEYDNIGFPARASSPGAFVALDVTNTQYSARGESPMYGALGFLKAQIEKENGLTYLQNDFQLVACNNGYSGQKLAFMIKGTTPYTAVMSQATSGKAIATATGRSFGALATFLTIGANDGNPGSLTPTSTFKSQLLQYAVDLNDDFKAATGQLRDSVLILGQVASRAPQLAVAQLEASNESGLVFMAAPMYFLSYYDTLHIDPTSEKWLGGYYGLAEKRVIVDRVGWSPLQPLSYMRVANDVYVTFNKSQLVFDTTLVSAQTNSGFDCVDSVGAAVAFSAAPQIVGQNVVKFSFSSTPPAGSFIRAGHNVSSGRTDAFLGGSCNLRDNQGDSIKYTFTVSASPVVKPMHNWCAIFALPI